MYYIYRITNNINGKTYIGQHKYKKLNDSYMGSGKLLKRAFDKYGIENFTKEILYSKIQYQETADDMEKFAIAKERALGKAEYNIADGGQGVKGLKHSEETKKKISESKKGCATWNKGLHTKGNNTGKHWNLSNEAKENISKGHKGLKYGPMTDEHKQNLSKIHKGWTWKKINNKRVWIKSEEK